ncbi:hypothetical protein RugamoR64_12780 [Duganella rhizosphaerae]
MDIGFLDDRRQGLPGSPTGLQKTGKIAAATQLGNFQVDSAGAGFPGAITVAVAAVDTFVAALAVSRLAQRLDIHLHEPLQGKLQRLFDEIGIGTLGGKFRQRHSSGVGHCDLL